MMPSYTTLPLRAGEGALCAALKVHGPRSVYLRGAVASRVASAKPQPSASPGEREPVADPDAESAAEAVEGEEEERPEHEPCHPLDKIWLPTYTDENTQDAKHDWCLNTGIIRNQGGEEARPRGFWVAVLHKLQRRLAKESDKTRMAGQLTDAQKRIILHELDALEGFYDRWWRTESSQVHKFVQVVQKWRSDVSERVIVDTIIRMW